MAHRRRQHRGKRERRKEPRKIQSTQRRTYDDPTYGEIPLVQRTMADADGGAFTYWDYDPAHEPALPAGAVRADIEKQVRCCGAPKYYYRDQDRACVQCGQDFVFSAREQKYWYESLQFYMHSTAIRCARCRKRRRSARALNQALAAAVHAVNADPDDPASLLQLAEASVAHAERFGSKTMDRAIAAVRRAHRQRPELLEALYWEGRCHRLAGRPAKARSCLEAFLSEASSQARLRRMVRSAKRIVERGPRT